jgi:large subunit ribosomal protein L3
MSIGLVGKKCGMTRLFLEDGSGVPVTVVAVSPNRITQIKTMEKDGYAAIQISTGKKSAARIDKPSAGHFAKAGMEAGDGLWEFVIPTKNSNDFAVGNELKVDLFQVGQSVDVQGVSKGKGFAGTVKRHNFRTQDATHGNSVSHRVPGSIGQRQTPGRVFPGKRMAGHLGNAVCSVQSQKIMKVDVERNLLLISGAIPGAPGGIVKIFPAVKGKVKKEGN